MPTTKAYTVELRIADKTYKEKSETILEGLENLAPQVIKGKGILTIKKGKMQAQIVLYPPQLKRLIVNRITRQILDKRLNLALK